MKNFWNRYAAWIQRRSGLILLASLVLAIAGSYYSVLLYKNLKSDLEELLPETAQSVKDVKAVSSRVVGLNHLSVVIETSNREAGLKFQKAVSEELRKLPKDLVARVQDNIQAEMQFFEKNKSLYVDLADWEGIQKYVRERMRSERKKSNPFSLGLDEEEGAAAAGPTFDFAGLKKKYEERASGAARFPDGYFESRDGRLHVILAFLPGKVTAADTNDRLLNAAREIVAKLDPHSYAPDMVVGYNGDVANMVEEHHGLTEDLVSSAVLVALLCAGVLLIFFRNFWGVYALCAALFAGVAITFGVSYFVVGYLNANTAFMGSIVIGNGINFGIIMLSRYFEERRAGRSVEEALPTTMRFTSHATWAAAVAAGTSYLSLIATDFRGFNQFGIIGGIGMLFCWIASFLILPAFLTWLEKREWIKFRGEVKHSIAEKFAHFVTKNYLTITVLSVLMAVGSISVCLTVKQDLLETDFRKLRNKWSLEHGSGYWATKVDSVFERYLTPTVILTSEESDTPKVVAELEKLRAKEGENSPISEIKTVQDFVPKDQTKKMEIIRKLESALTPEVRKRLTPEERDFVAKFFPVGKKVELNPVHVSDLPEGVLVNFRELDGTVGRMVHIYPQLPTAAKEAAHKANFWDGREVIRFAETLRKALKEAGVPGVIAGQPPLSADLISSISSDGPKATAYAFGAVILLVFLLFPSWKLSRSILGALVLGVLWMAGVIVAFDLKINFLNFIALPITFGIGVDYAVNIFSRYQADGIKGAEGVRHAISNTGGAVTLCSMTTTIGYGSLLIAGSQAFVSFGWLAVLGEFTCLTAALMAIPAFWTWAEKRRERKEGVRTSAEASL